MTGHDFSEHDDAPVSTNEPAANRAPRRWVLPQMQTELEALPEIDDIRKEIETHLAADETIPPGLLRRYAALWHTTFQLDRHILSFAWPGGTVHTNRRGLAKLLVRRTAAREPLPVAVSGNRSGRGGSQHHGWVVVRLRVTTAWGGR